MGTANLTPLSRPSTRDAAGRSGSAAPCSLSAAVSTAPFGDTVEETILLCLTCHIEQWYQTQSEGGHRGTHVPVSTDAGRGGCDPRQADPVSAEAIGDTQRHDPAGNQCLPSVPTVEDGIDDVRYRLLLRTE